MADSCARVSFSRWFAYQKDAPREAYLEIPLPWYEAGLPCLSPTLTDGNQAQHIYDHHTLEDTFGYN